MEKLTLWSAMKLPNSKNYVIVFKGHALYKYDIISPNKQYNNKLLVTAEPVLIVDGYVVIAEPIEYFEDVYLNTGTYYELVEESVGESQFLKR